MRGANEYIMNTYQGIYTGGVEDLVVVWVDEGEEFIINEYDGSERKDLLDKLISDYEQP